MKFTKIVSSIAGLSLFAMSLMPGVASAASATMSLSGSTQTNGNFAVTVYENSGDGRATSVFLALAFSPAVGNISYDYSVGPFTTTDPSGGHLVQGSVTGSQPVARVSFTVANPSSVTASVAGSSYLKGTSADGKSLVNYDITPGSAVFTYNAPAAATTPTPTNTSPSSPAATKKAATTTTTPATTGTTTKTPTTTNTTTTTTTGSATPEVKGDSTTKATTDKKADAKNTADKKKSNKLVPFILIVLAGIIAFVGGRYAARYLTDRKAAQAAALAAAATAKKASKASDTKKKPSAKKTK